MFLSTTGSFSILCFCSFEAKNFEEETPVNIIIRHEGIKLIDKVDHTLPKAKVLETRLLGRFSLVHLQIEKGNSVFLDCRHIGSNFNTRFPQVSSYCENADLDPERDLLPIIPVAHYHIGGVKTDLKGQTSVEGLWCCGEVAATGIHGANRLASNSLLESLVFAKIVANEINKKSDSVLV